jgi:hypothetical protein
MTLIKSLEIDDHILDKIESKHEEAEESCLSSPRYIRRSRSGLYKLYGQTENGRYLLTVLVNLGDGHWKIVTCRDMNDAERHLYTQR